MQNCELKEFSAFQDYFCLSNGNIARFPALSLDFDFLAEFFVCRFSVAFATLTAEKYTPKFRGKLRWKISVKRFSVRFSVHFSEGFSVSNFLPRNQKNLCRIRSAREIPLT